MKARALVTSLLTLVFCFTAIFPLGAAQPTAKDLMLGAIKNFDLGIDKGFYEKSRGEANLEVTSFGGSMREQLGDYSGAKIRLITELDDSQKAMRLGYNTNIKGNVVDGEIYLTDDKVLLTKDFFYLLQDFGFNPLENSSISLAEVPEYFYVSDSQLSAVWEQMATYQNQKLPEEYIELLLFMAEAIPEENFSLSATKATLRLDQDGLVDTVFNLLTKMNNESDRVAEMLVGINQQSFEQMGLDPAEVKREMASGLKNMTVPTREEIMTITNFIELKDFTFEYSLLPGGPKKLNVEIAFKAPDGSVSGAFTIAMDARGKQGNLEGVYRMAGNYNDSNGIALDFAADNEYRYRGTVYNSDTTVKAVAKDNKTGELLLDFGLVGDSVSEVDTGLILKVPVLTSDNSMDITDLISSSAAAVNVGQPEDIRLNLVVNGVAVEAKPRMEKQGEIMVPAREVLERLGYQVEWVDPDELRIINEETEASLFINKDGFTINGAEKKLNAAPYREAGESMIPISFIASDLGVEIKIMEGSIVLTN